MACFSVAIQAQETAINPIADQQFFEDSGLRQIALSGILPGDGAGGLNLSVTIADDSLALPSVGPVAGDGTAVLYLNPLPNAYGSSTVTVRVSDDRGGSAEAAFQLTVLAVNDAPGLNPISDITVDEDSAQFSVPLTGIHTGAANESQQLSISALVSDATLLGTPVVVYQNGNSTGSLLLTPQANAAGSCSVAVIISDDGGTANGGSNQQIQVFTVTVDNSNDAPLLIRNEILTVGQSSSATISALDLAVSDDDPAADLTYTITGEPTAGQLERTGTPLLLNDSFSQADIDGGLLRYVHGGGMLTSDAFSCDLRDPAGLGFALTVTIDIVATSANQAPQLAIGAGERTYQEGASPLLLADQGLLSDAEGNLGGGRLTVSIASGAEADDRLSLLTDSSITVSGSLVSYLGQPLALLSGGSGSQPLFADLDAAATQAGIQALIRHVAFSHLGQQPMELSRQITFVVRDNQAADSAPVSRQLRVEAVNDAPAISLSRSQVTWFENSSGLLLDDALLLGDPDSADFALGQVLVSQTSGGQSGDRFDLQTNARLQIDGDQVLVDDLPIGTLSGGAHPDALRIDLNAFATPDLVTVALRALRFTGSDDEPVSSLRSIDLRCSDGDGGTGSATLQLNVVAVNDAPVLNAGSPLTSWREGDGPTPVDAAVLLSDGDSSSFAGGVIQASLSPAGHSLDRLLVQANADITVTGDQVLYQGTPIASGDSEAQSLLLALNADCTVAAAGALLRSIAFDNGGTAPGDQQRGIVLRISDGDGGTSNQLSSTLSVIDVNTAPAFSALSSSATYIEDEAPAILSPTVTISDQDHSDLGAGFLRCQISAGAETADRLRLVHQGIAIGEIGLSGDLVLDGGMQVGLLTGQDSDDLRIEFDPGVSPALASRIAGRIAFAHDGNAPGAQARSVTFTCSDGSDSGNATVSVNVTGINDAPSADTHRFAALSRAFGDLTFRYRLSGQDPDGDPLQWQISQAPQTGTATLVGDELSYQVGADALGTDTLLVTVDDGQATSQPIAVQILITDLDDSRPQITSDPPPVVQSGDSWLYRPLVDTSDLTVSGDTTFGLFGDTPTGLLLETDASGTTLRLDTASGPGHYRFGIMFTDSLSGWSGYQPIMLNIIDPPGGDG